MSAHKNPQRINREGIQQTLCAHHKVRTLPPQENCCSKNLAGSAGSCQAAGAWLALRRRI